MRALLVALATVALAGCGAGESKEAQATAPPATSGGAIAGTSLDGNLVSLDQFRGRPVLVNVWSSW